MFRGVYLLRLLDGAVIQPEDDVVVIMLGVETGGGYGDGLVRVMREDC